MGNVPMFQVDILTLDGFNEIDSFVALNILNRADKVRAELVSMSDTAKSMNGVVVSTEDKFNGLSSADAVLVGSGINSRQYAADPLFLQRLRLDPQAQLIGSQCSGALILHAKGLLPKMAVSTDDATRPALERMGAMVSRQSFTCHDRVATAGGCLSSIVLSAWVLTELLGERSAKAALRQVAPIGNKDEFVEETIRTVKSGCCAPQP